MDVRRALTYLFGDAQWPAKLGIAMLLNLLPTAVNAYRQFAAEGGGESLTGNPVGNLLWSGAATFAMIPLYGYLLRILRGVVAGTDAPLPEWSDARRLLRDGLLLWGVVFLWGLPVTLLGSIGDPTSGEGDAGRVLLYLVLMLLVLFVVCVVLVVQPAAEARLAVTGSFLPGVDVRAALVTVRRNLGGYVRLLLITVAGGLGVFGAGFVLVWLARSVLGGTPEVLDVLPVATILVGATLGPYLQFVLFHLYGQVYVRAMP